MYFVRYSTKTGQSRASCERIIYIFLSSKSNNGNVKNLGTSMSLFNSPTKSAYKNITFVFDASTLSYCTLSYCSLLFDASTLSYCSLLLSHGNLLNYWLSSILCCQSIFSRFWAFWQYIKTEMLMRVETFLLTFFNMLSLLKQNCWASFPSHG